MKKLYDLPRNRWVLVLNEDTKVPPGAKEINKDDLIFFHHVDGMYSLCEDSKGNIVHLAAWTEVKDVTHLIKKTPEGITIDENYIEPTFEVIRETIGRSGYGKDGTGKYRESTLKDMSDNWVKASIDFVDIDHDHHKYYVKELEYRKEHSITIEDVEEDDINDDLLNAACLQ